jgi:hypothetical protein
MAVYCEAELVAVLVIIIRMLLQGKQGISAQGDMADVLSDIQTGKVKPWSRKLASKQRSTETHSII